MQDAEPLHNADGSSIASEQGQSDSGLVADVRSMIEQTP